MKIFIVRKENEMNEGKENSKKVTIKKDEKFNYIIIKNPYDSNKICTINRIRVINKEIPNKICLMVGEEELYREWDEDSDVKKIDIFNFKIKNIQKEYNSNIEINSSDILMNEECNILKDFKIIMLPKGCIFIKLDKEVNFFNMNISWTSEEIL
ncbi:hypothetical protein RBU49_13405 [Clostridium sp. MB40-C1]|uniref:hypothetical protein n=1 Tax=Clostridium sp. MB40-C1 TaxID=3070996 RepID=UPI0027DF07F0|nr:hypothetical protein [Clostridium sp. MB40-C1]WMJ79856.1 hypothetical protein RBU49_13405 [Clostridium sp. MB40-C1]